MRDRKLKVIKGGRSRRNKFWLRLFALGIVVLTGFLVWNSLGQISLLAAKVTVARHSQVKTGVPVTCVVLRNEQVVTAPADGKYIPLVADGTRVKVGQVFAQIERAGGNVNLTSPAAGLIRHGADGLEEELSQELNSRTVQAAAGVVAKLPVLKEEFDVKKNQPVAAVIINIDGYSLLTGMNFHSDGKKQTLKTELSTGQELTYTIYPQDVLEYDSLFWVLWEAPTLPDVLGLQRAFTAEMVTAEQDLVLIPQGALYTKDGERGVFILYRSRPVFSPVEVLYSEAGMVGVSGLGNGERVLSLPQWASFAKRWWE